MTSLSLRAKMGYGCGIIDRVRKVREGMERGGKKDPDRRWSSGEGRKSIGEEISAFRM